MAGNKQILQERGHGQTMGYEMNYKIRTEGFEKILLAMQHITQRIKKGEKCTAIIEYDPDAPFTKITTVIEQSNAEEFLWALEQDKKTGFVTMVPMNGERIVIHGKQEAEMFCNALIQCFQ